MQRCRLSIKACKGMGMGSNRKLIFRNWRFARIALIFLLQGNAGLSGTLVVSQNGKIKTIGEAVAMACAGDAIVITQGVYRESGIVIDKKLHIIGRGFPIIDGGDANEDILVVRSDGTRIEGLDIRNVKTNYVKDLAGIALMKVRNCTIRNNRLSNTFFGIYLQNSAGCIVSGNQVIGEAAQEASSGNALHLWKCRNIVLENNILKRHRDGIYIEFTDSTKISNNLSENNLRYGLHFMFSNNNTYIENTFRSNGAGVAVMFSKHIVMQKNLFENNWGGASYGLLLKDITDSEIAENIFRKNTIGVYGESASRINLTGNDFEENGWAMKMTGSCIGNEITGNNFIANTFDVSSVSSGASNKYSRNYWSSYSGYDLDKDGVGDTPYHPVSLFCYLSKRVPEAIILQRSLFVHMINFAEKVAPALTPANLKDDSPLMKMIKR